MLMIHALSHTSSAAAYILAFAPAVSAAVTCWLCPKAAHEGWHLQFSNVRFCGSDNRRWIGPLFILVIFAQILVHAAVLWRTLPDKDPLPLIALLLEWIVVLITAIRQARAFFNSVQQKHYGLFSHAILAFVLASLCSNMLDLWFHVRLSEHLPTWKTSKLAFAGSLEARIFLNITATVLLLTVRRLPKYRTDSCNRSETDSLLSQDDQWNSTYFEESHRHLSPPYSAAKPCPEIGSSLLSSFTFTWINDLLAISKHRQLHFQDLYDPPQHYMLPSSWKRFKSFINSGSSLELQLAATFKFELAMQLAYNLLCVLLEYAQPFFMQKLLRFIAASTSNSPASLHYGYFLAGCLLAANLLLTVLQQQQDWGARTLFMHIRNTLMVMITRKAIYRKPQDAESSLDSNGKSQSKNSDTGRLYSILTVDLSRLSKLMKLVRATTTVPLQLVIGAFYMRQLLGMAGILGTTLLIIVVYLTRKLIAQAKKIESKLGKANDQRLAVINEVIQGISSVKLMGWKNQFVQAIGNHRHKQLSMMWKRAKLASVINLCTIGSFPFVVFATLAVYSHQNELNAEILFTAIAVFKIIQRSVDMLPSLVSYSTSLYVSFQRIKTFIGQQEIQSPDIQAANDRVGFNNATLVWNANSSFKLKNINVQFPSGELSVISGPTGSGKSSLLLALVGNMELIEGCISVPAHMKTSDSLELHPAISDIAYVSQEPWLRNDTIRDNILFGEPFNYERYETVLQMCALLPDLALSKAGDLTEVGERGITLSGGQQQRIALARAIYSSRKVLLIDDCLSAVDAHTGKHILHQCLLSTNKLMSGRTRILVTHHLSMCLPHADYMVMIDDGHITFQGTPDEARSNSNVEIVEFSTDSSSSATPCSDSSFTPINASPANTPVPNRASTDIALSSGRLTEDEARMKGAINLDTWSLYFKACGKQWFLAICVGYIITMQLLNMYKDYYLSNKLDRHRQPHNLITSEMKWLAAYLAFGILSAMIGSLGLLISYYGSRQASILLHTSLTESVLSARMRRLETIPTGRLISRFGSDMQEIDDNIMSGILDVLRPLVALLISLLVISAKFSQFYIIGAALLAIYVYFTLQFIQIQREVKRMDSIAFAPVISLYSELISGSKTIRAFGLECEFIAEMTKRYFIYHKAEFTKRSASRWMRIRISMTGSFVTFAMVLFIVANSHLIKSGLAGFIMVQTVGILQETLVAVRKYSDLELSLTAVERINQYLHIEHEPYIPQNRLTLPARWPTSGNLAVNNLITGYTSNAPILHNLSFSINHGEKIGVVGRTGAGKSSLTLALLRLIEPTSGSIVLDDVDIADVDLETLRKSITIIPQNPVLFNGTIRFNLDPFDEYPDAILMDALQHTLLLKDADIDSKNIAAFHSLDDLVMSNGQNLSLGQRQLVALARALVRRSHLVILDEATAAVDFETDSLIQQTIRGPEFANATMLCIAHRLHTIIDYDRIMVLNEGKIVEFDKPEALLKDEKGYFRHLCENSNDFGIMQKLSKNSI